MVKTRFMLEKKIFTIKIKSIIESDQSYTIPNNIIKIETTTI